MGTILLVEDDDATRYATARHLTRAGFVVIAVPSTLQALVKVNAGRSVDAFVIDLGMTAGDVPGLLFGLMMHRRLPAAPKLFVTDFPDLIAGSRVARPSARQADRSRPTHGRNPRVCLQRPVAVTIVGIRCHRSARVAGRQTRAN
jgi:CheY-like chemotaxis protein